MKNIGRKVAFIGACLLSLLLIGLLDLVSVGFSWEEIMTPAFWLKLTAKLFANYMILFSTADETITTLNEKDEVVVEEKAEVKKLVKNEIFPDFEEYVAIDNKQRKIDAWKEHISKKISKLENRASLEDNETYWYGKPQDKANNKYCKKRKQLEYKMSDEYIKRNILYINISYYKIKSQIIKTGCKQDDDIYKIETHRAWRIIKDNKGKFMVSTAFAIVTSTLIPELKDFTWVTVLLLTMNIFVLLYNMWCGRTYGVQYKDNVLIPDLQYRKDYIMNYIGWRVKKSKEVK